MEVQKPDASCMDTRVSMEVIVTNVSKLVYFTHLGDENNLLRVFPSRGLNESGCALGE